MLTCEVDYTQYQQQGFQLFITLFIHHGSIGVANTPRYTFWQDASWCGVWTVWWGDPIAYTSLERAAVLLQ